MNDSHNPYEHDEDVLGENMQEGDAKTKYNGRREEITTKNLIETMKSFNERLIKDQEEHNHINFSILESLTNIQ